MFEWTVSNKLELSQQIFHLIFIPQEYAINLAKQLGVGGILKQDPKNLGKDLAPDSIEEFKSEQIVQLHELYKTAKGLEDEDDGEKVKKL